jgi:hypothetical protein
MPNLVYPFSRLRYPDSSSDYRGYTRLPLRVNNPATGQHIIAWGLVDTGADASLVPASLARLLGHKLKGKGVKITLTGGIEQTRTTAYRHTFETSLLSPNLKRRVWTQRMEIDCLESDPPLLLGVDDFLCHFELTLNYPGEEMRLSWL